ARACVRAADSDVVRAVEDPDATEVVSGGVVAAGISADEIPLNQGAGGDGVANENTILGVARDNVARTVVGAANERITRAAENADAALQVRDGKCAGGIEANVVTFDNVVVGVGFGDGDAVGVGASADGVALAGVGAADDVVMRAAGDVHAFKTARRGIGAVGSE